MTDMFPVARKTDRGAVNKIERRGLMDALDASQALVWFDANGMIVDANDNALELFDYSEQDILKQDYYALCKSSPNRHMADQREWARIADGQMNHTERNYKTRTGQEVWASVNFSSIKTESGRTRRVVAIFTDLNQFSWKPNDVRRVR